MSSPLGSSALISPEANASEQSRKELQAKLTGLGGLNGRNLSAEAKEKKLREACEGFESIFIQKMWQEMRNTIPKGGMMHGKEERFWQDMYDQELSKSMTKAGGIGLADMMYEQLSRGLVSASRSAAGLAQGAAFAPSAAPLVPAYQSDSQDVAHTAQNMAANSIYEGQAPQVASNASEDGEPEASNDGNSGKQGHSVSNEETPQSPVQPIGAQAVAAVSPATVPNPKIVEAEPVASKHKVKKADLNNNSGLEMAYMARREAGDKLGSHAVRPALHQRQQRNAERTSQPATESGEVSAPAQAARPGSPAALAAAIKLAHTGGETSAIETGQSLDELVARVKAQNASAQATVAQTAQQIAAVEQPVVSGVDETEAPVTRKVRFSTNVPSKNKSKKSNNQAIRMLNVDNVGVNSKAGQGIAAYHAAQQSGAPQPQPVAPVSEPQQPAQPVQPIAPLTAKQASAEMPDNGGNFNIPPLTAGGLNS